MMMMMTLSTLEVLWWTMIGFLGVLGTGIVVGLVWVIHYWVSGEPANVEDYIEFKDPKLRLRYQKTKIPIQVLHDAYFQGKVDLKEDLLQTLEKRDEYSLYSKITPAHVKFILTRFIPETLIHSRSQDERQISEHYNKGNDFFEWFLGEKMIYTSGLFANATESLETAQDRKCQTICEKLHMKKNLRVLDIGCGWGTFIRYVARNFQSDVTGVTLSIEGKKWHDDEIQRNVLPDGCSAKVLHSDYRDIPHSKYDRITCIEMAEHVGVKNFSKFMSQIYGLLKDDGLFYLQIAGLRRAWQFQDIVWGLFMDKYIFCGADASTPLGFTVNELEKAGFEIHSIENIGIHYSITIKKWYDNWLKNKSKIVGKYGEGSYRVWLWFLAWAVIIARQGSSTCWQIVLNKNINHFDRTQWVSPTRI